jgi:hypothetical protein
LPRFTDCALPLDTWRPRFGFLSQALCLFGKALFEGRGLLETASLHGAAPFLERWVLAIGQRQGGETAIGVFISDKAAGRRINCVTPDTGHMVNLAHMRKINRWAPAKRVTSLFARHATTVDQLRSYFEAIA